MAKVTVIKTNNKIKKINTSKYLYRRYYKHIMYGIITVQFLIIMGLVYGK